MIGVYFLNKKSEVFSKFVQVKTFVEKQSGCKLEVLRTDRGGEFISNEFQDFCKSHGIKKELTPRNTSTKWSGWKKRQIYCEDGQKHVESLYLEQVSNKSSSRLDII